MYLAPTVLLPASAFATEIYGQDISIDVSPIYALAGVILTALASIWVVKKVLRTGNRN